MRLYKRMALGAIIFGVIGPLIIAFCFATLAAVIVTVHDYEGLGKLVGGWLSMFLLGSMLAFIGGWVPATVVGVFVGAMATRLRRRYLYPIAVLGAPVVVILYFAFCVDGPSDTPILFGGGFSIPATIALSRLLLAIIRRSQVPNPQGEQASGGST
ncbi:hypothetical protein [Paraburkholderia heleia]|uniref:hypothetical protein n=1 Tax=Paraburkholderia heleia TaxID=634127 RepID=UPI0012EE9470|nr:hypothetical protein [Paraburkholderia heleia]